jgi:hypothetical protein
MKTFLQEKTNNRGTNKTANRNQYTGKWEAEPVFFSQPEIENRSKDSQGRQKNGIFYDIKIPGGQYAIYQSYKNSPGAMAGIETYPGLPYSCFIG